MGEPEKEIHPVNEFPGERRVMEDETGSLNEAGTAEFRTKVSIAIYAWMPMIGMIREVLIKALPC